MGRVRKGITKEFNREAVPLITNGEQSIAQVARDFGPQDTTLGQWKKESPPHQEAAFSGKGQPRPDGAELRQLHRDNERLRMERDILKKAAARFSKDSL